MQSFQGLRPDLNNIPLKEPEEIYTNGGSYILDGTRVAGAAAVGHQGTVAWAQARGVGAQHKKLTLLP